MRFNRLPDRKSLITEKMSSFFSKLQARTEAVNSFLCVGLDPHIKELFPDFDFSNDEKSWQSSITEETRCETAYNFCVSIVDQTGEYFNQWMMI